MLYKNVENEAYIDSEFLAIKVEVDSDYEHFEKGLSMNLQSEFVAIKEKILITKQRGNYCLISLAMQIFLLKKCENNQEELNASGRFE